MVRKIWSISVLWLAGLGVVAQYRLCIQIQNPLGENFGFGHRSVASFFAVHFVAGVTRLPGPNSGSTIPLDRLDYTDAGEHHWSTIFRSLDQNRGPFHLVPVMENATLERLS